MMMVVVVGVVKPAFLWLNLNTAAALYSLSLPLPLSSNRVDLQQMSCK